MDSVCVAEGPLAIKGAGRLGLVGVGIPYKYTPPDRGEFPYLEVGLFRLDCHCVWQPMSASRRWVDEQIRRVAADL